jgi:hypothetical protein
MSDGTRSEAIARRLWKILMLLATVDGLYEFYDVWYHPTVEGRDYGHLMISVAMFLLSWGRMDLREAWQAALHGEPGSHPEHVETVMWVAEGLTGACFFALAMLNLGFYESAEVAGKAYLTFVFVWLPLTYIALRWSLRLIVPTAPGDHSR